MQPRHSLLGCVGVLILDDRSKRSRHDAMATRALFVRDRAQDVPLGEVQSDGFWDGKISHALFCVTATEQVYVR